jgi:signal transduction histidine kinase
VQETDIVPAYLDEQRMVQVFNNLIGNAIKYSARGSTIEIGLKHVVERPQEVLIWVKDEGIGIAAEDIPHIFKRFHRARNVDRSHSGFGIGLYLVKEVVTQHRGRVWVDSCEGEGSTFYVTLPLAVSI